MFVAKSYKNLKQLTQPFQKNGKLFITIETKAGALKNVRAYTEKEYFRLYPEEKQNYNNKISKVKPWDKYYKSQKLILGFDKGYVTLMAGAKEEDHVGWLQGAGCRFHNIFGWYLPSSLPEPEAYPEGICPIRLNWEPVGNEEDWLIDDKTAIRNYIKNLF